MPKTVRQVEKALRAAGWVRVRTTGDHHQWEAPDGAFVVTVPGSPGTELAVGTLASIRKATGLKELR